MSATDSTFLLLWSYHLKISLTFQKADQETDKAECQYFCGLHAVLCTYSAEHLHENHLSVKYYFFWCFYLADPLRMLKCWIIRNSFYVIFCIGANCLSWIFSKQLVQDRVVYNYTIWPLYECTAHTKLVLCSYSHAVTFLLLWAKWAQIRLDWTLCPAQKKVRNMLLNIMKCYKNSFSFRMNVWFGYDVMIVLVEKCCH